MNLKLNRAIRQILLAGAATALTAGAFSLAQAAITPGVQTVPPGPGQVPDYFGVSPNYATSATPNFALVTITDATGTGAVAAATTVDYLNPNFGITPAGMYTGNLMDVQLISGGANYSAATSVIVTGNNGAAATSTSLTPIIVGGVIAGFVEIPHGDIKDAAGTIVTNGAAWLKDTGTGQWIMPGGVDGVGPYWAGVGAIYDALGNVSGPSNFTKPIPGTGIRKFVDSVSLPGSVNNLGQTLSVADPLVYTNPFTGSDYYEIAEVAYTQQMHTDLPPTHLRGYIQLVPNTPGSNAVDITTLTNIQTSVPAGTYYVKAGTTNASYLGPVIVAQKNKAVRMKVVNLLPTGAAGALPFPVDHTYMGAGNQDKLPANNGVMLTEQPDTRTAVHLHGGTTPWISDGTPRQWFTPAGEAGPIRGVSATDVPDMWFDGSGNLLANSATCTQGTTTCTTAGATNNPGAGALTFYYTNEQSARLMFYHDHAEGVTRLNVYAGMAAGYIMQDPTEQAMTHGTTSVVVNNVDGTSSTVATDAAGVTTLGNASYSQVLPEDVIPLVVQEKTFVPDNKNPVLTFYGPFRSQLNAQDPTWRWGTLGAGNPLGSWDGVTGGYQNPIAGQFAAAAAIGLNGPGDLWVPHVFMTNQNPGDVSGANPQGRWDYGSWFWPPATGIVHPQVQNPYWDSTCTSANITNPVGTCEFQYIPGFPNGGNMPANTQAVSCTFTKNGRGTSVKTCTPTGVVAPEALNAMKQASGTPEAFNDTSVVNGTVYPYMNVSPKKYRLRILSVGNDRTLNLSLWVASNKNVDTTSAANAGATSVAATGATCTGTSANAAADCTEVRMVPWDATQNVTSKFPTWWYTTLKGGITFDGRPGGVPDPKTRGPAMVQIGTEGGFLAAPAVIKNQPVNYEYNVKNILVTNIKEHALLLGAAERADVVVDFSQFAGSTLIMYNDAPAATPAFDLRLDYFTGGFDNTDTGGTFQTVAGYGPNTRTVMQFRVAADCTGDLSGNCGTGINRTPASTNPVDDVHATWLTSLTTEVRKAFKFSQEPIVVPQAAYNAVYGTSVADATGQNLSAIGDTALSFTPFTVDQNPNSATNGAVTLSPLVTLGLEPKAIQELFTLDYGRMNATLGTEIPNTTATTQTTIPLGYVEPPTELVQMTKDNPNLVIGGNIGQLADGTQIWKITHNGVDTHPVHFHLFSVQLINRVGWDGAIYNPDANETGWKEVVRMNPLSDVIVALRPKTLSLPFKLGNSHHIADTTQDVGSLINQPNLNPTTGNASNVTNQVINYGWEYVWHCHILGHEENDFMRAIAVAQVPEDPSQPQVTVVGNDNVISWTDNSVVSNWVTIERSTDATFPNTVAVPTTAFNVLNPVSVGGYNAFSECTQQAGCARTWTDVGGVAAGNVYYRVTANSTVGAGDSAIPGSPKLPPEVASLTNNFTGYDNVTANSAAVVSGGVIAPKPVAGLSSNALTYNQLVNSTTTQTVTVSNTGTGPLTVASVVLTPTVPGFTGFTTTNTCNTPVAANGTCKITVNYTPTVATAAGVPDAATITVTDNSNGVVGSTQAITLSGTAVGVTGTLAGNGAFGTVANGGTSPTSLFTLTNTTALPITLAAAPATLTGTNANQFSIASNTCANAALAVNGTCTIGVNFKPTSNGNKVGTLSVALPNGGTTLTAALTGTGANGAVGVLTTPTAFSATVGTISASKVITLSSTGVNPLVYSAITPSAGFTVTGGSCGAAGNLSLGNSCTINVAFAPTVAGVTTGTLSIVDNSGLTNALQTTTQTVALSGTGVAATGVPAAPTVANLTATTLTLNWSAVSGATSYTVQRATNAAFTGTITTVATGVTVLTRNVTGLTGNTTYYFRVVAVDAAGTPTNGTASGAVLTLPGTPTGVNAANGQRNAPVTGGLNWNTVAGLTYTVSWTGPATGSATATSGQQLPFTTAGTYSMTVKAVNASGTGVASTAVNVTVR